MRKKSDHERTVARIRKSLAPLTPCIHVDADGYCIGCNAGVLCVKCADYTPKTKEELRQSAVATVEPVKVPLTDDQAANAIRKQYQVVIRAEAATFRERVRFGGMLLQWERFLGESRGCKSAGDGLKGWLEKNCPEIGYSAARGYKTMAERAIKMLGGGAVVTAALLGNDQVTQPDGEVIDVPAEEARKCNQFFEKADSRRKLEQMWFEFTNGEGERPKKKAKRKVVAVAEGDGLSMSDSATVMWADAMRPFAENRAAFHSAARDLKPAVARKFLSELKMLVEALEKRVTAD
ncbi:MAG: hypothetical protein J6T51_06500 [Kiritimatiellae bacterium]|nr:hypothetical protein [Kiritimatiellia bacterium]